MSDRLISTWELPEVVFALTVLPSVATLSFAAPLPFAQHHQLLIEWYKRDLRRLDNYYKVEPQHNLYKP
jgi:hypothetical protein